MQDDSLNFDATTVAPATGEFEPVPDDMCVLHVETATKKDTGWSLQIKVLDATTHPESKGKSFNIFLNLDHQNQTPREIAQKEFSALCHVVGVLRPRNMSELYKKPFMGKVKATPPRKDEKTGTDYGPGNKIAQYLYLDGKKLGESGAVAGSIGSNATSAPPRKSWGDRTGTNG